MGELLEVPLTINPLTYTLGFANCEGTTGVTDVTARRPMETYRTFIAGQSGRLRGHGQGQSLISGGGALDCPHRFPVARSARRAWQLAHDVYALLPLEQETGLGALGLRGVDGRRSRGAVARRHHRARPPACRRRPKKAGPQALGRSRGGFSTKIHAAVDALGNPLRCILTGGEVAEITQAEALLAGWPLAAVIADKGYDANALVEWINARGAIAVIPPRSNRLQPREYDRHLYRDRNLVERFFNRIKHFRRIATRYEKLSRNFLSMLNVVCALIWLA